MGFQFNHVGGGTKTRRPITLHMKYNSACVQPVCFLCTDDSSNASSASSSSAPPSNEDAELTLEELREYIEAENARLEREGQFWAKEIVVKIEYKYCPNLTIIDTPGLISAAPGRRNHGLQASARQVEAMVRAKMEQREYIILCLEDSNDWSNATTRRLVMAVDPHLSRSVVVSTKLDTRLPQFARGSDVELFLRPPGRLLEPGMLGGCPFFTSVPSGRVGNAKDAVFRSNEHFRAAVAEREAADVDELERRLDRRLDRGERARIGVTQLRRFLEQLLQRRYLENVPAIVPLLEREYRCAARRLEATQEELNDLHPDKLKDKGRSFREAFLSKLGLLLRGTVAAPADRFGETLADEHVRGGAFVLPDGKPLAPSPTLANAHMRLYGGAQYHRAMAEFRSGVGSLPCPDISREEIVNACGVDEFHDGVNYTRTACVIAVAKAADVLEPLVHQLGFRVAHVLRRLLPVSMHLLARDGAYPDGHDLFLQRVGAAYHAFVEGSERGCRARCLEDLASTTRYVTWSLHTKGRDGLRGVLSRPQSNGAGGSSSDGSGNGNNNGSSALVRRGGDSSSNSAPAAASDVATLLESTLWNRQLGVVSEELVAALVCQIFEGIRDHVVQAVELKFNCFFLMPLVDSFPARLREELEAAYDDLDSVFDVGAVRASLEGKLRSLESELAQVERLQRKFASIHSTLAQQASVKPQQKAGGGGAEGAGSVIDVEVDAFGSGAAGENAASAAAAAAEDARAARLADKLRGVAVSASADVVGRASVGGGGAAGSRAALSQLR